jgi:hypothetical protein
VINSAMGTFSVLTARDVRVEAEKSWTGAFVKSVSLDDHRPKALNPIWSATGILCLL